MVNESMKKPSISRMPIIAKTVPILFLFKGYFKDNSVAIKRITNGNMDVNKSAETIEIVDRAKLPQILIETMPNILLLSQS